MSRKSFKEVSFVFTDSFRGSKDALLDEVEHCLVRLGQNQKQNVRHICQFFVGRGVDHQIENDSVDELISHLKDLEILLLINTQILLCVLDAYLQEL